MKAIVCPRYGSPDVLHLAEVPTPTPGPDELLIRVRATAVTAGDYRVRALDVPTGFKLMGRLALGVTGPRKPILGTVLSGVVDAIGAKVERFEVGDEVFGGTGGHYGAYAEFVCLPQDAALAPKPSNLTHEEAAAIPFGAITALYFLKERADVQPGEKVLVYGASGAVGTASVQFAKHLEAEVTGVCSSANQELVRSLGADHVVDYTREDFAGGGEQYDVVMETVGKASPARCMAALKPKGRLLLVAASVPEHLRARWISWTTGKRVIGGIAMERSEHLTAIRALVESGTLRPVIDRHYPLEETAEAHRYADTGRKRGSVVITVGPNEFDHQGAVRHRAVRPPTAAT